MKRRKTSRVTIEIYDEDGVLCESVGGPMTHEEVKDQMIEILRNDGIPVIRQHGKHEAVEETGKDNRKLEEMPSIAKVLTEALESWGKPKATVHFECGEIKPLSIPMVLEYEFDGIKFHAAGHPLDVHTANRDLLMRIFEEDVGGVKFDSEACPPCERRGGRHTCAELYPGERCQDERRIAEHDQRCPLRKVRPEGGKVADDL